MSKASGTFRVGTSGWQYDHWKGVFYPEDLPKKKWFEFYTQYFDCVEINNTFYRLPGAKAFDAWKAAAPNGFEYTLKFSRFGSHMKKLKDPDNSVVTFLSVAERLKGALGPILVQLPPGWHVDVERLDAFLKFAPKRQRWAVELREQSWVCEEVFEVLRKHNAALVIHDLIDNQPKEVTADFVYLRFHGPDRNKKYTGGYSPQYLSARAREIRGWLKKGLDVYAFFNNDAEGDAVIDAQRLREYVTK